MVTLRELHVDVGRGKELLMVIATDLVRRVNKSKNKIRVAIKSALRVMAFNFFAVVVSYNSRHI